MNVERGIVHRLAAECASVHRASLVIVARAAPNDPRLRHALEPLRKGEVPQHPSSSLAYLEGVLAALPDLLLVLDDGHCDAQPHDGVPHDAVSRDAVPRDAAPRVVAARGKGFGYEAPDLVGRTLADLVPGLTGDLLTAALEGRHDPHPDAPLRVRVATADGDHRPADIRLARSSSLGAIVALVRPVSEAARIAERELVTVVCAAPEAIVTWSLDGTIVSFNPAAVRLYGMSPAEAVGGPVERLVPEAARRAFEESVRRVLEGEPPVFAEVLRLRDGEEISVEEKLFVLRDVTQRVVRVGSFARDVAEMARLRRAAAALASPSSPLGEVSASPAMKSVLELAEVAAREGDATVLIVGETGVGKSWLARRIHEHSARAARPFLTVNCASFEPQLLESELFGHERGAFTGATHAKMGLVEAAEGGTLFLDEIGELPLPVQAKLLGFLDDRTYRRLGGTRTLTADVRILAATNVDLEAAVEARAFRKDLYYRLQLLPIRLPPLRERPEDLPDLIETVLRSVARGRAGRAGLRDDARAALLAYTWPGNLRELRNALERALLLSRGEAIALEHLTPEIRDPPPVSTHDAPNAPGPNAPGPSATLLEAERRHIDEVLASVGGNRTRAAEILGIDRSTLRRKLGGGRA